ncbi:hypothetical protein AB7M56_000238 [Bradyrhizobium elkanii]|nr:hypothetical protein [Bradyrhizobium elkanii]MCS3482257.1 hypothetical protein [Bradyrhizobium elkanii]MCS3525056.1 hypothetical protein [Bradyrhizobium elkanii]MCS4075732.1 hypothetical protein [Bradyrhizobium elkanii]MCS4085019.1 hypothetical protein [Bradyrhizobium elkanii]
MTVKNRIPLDNYYLPGDLERQIRAFVERYNHVRYHDSIDNLALPMPTSAGLRQSLPRKRIKRNTIANCRLHHQSQAAQTLPPMSQRLPSRNA